MIHDRIIEQSLIATAIHGNAIRKDAIADICSMSKDDFFYWEYQKIFVAIKELYKANIDISLTSVYNKLKDSNGDGQEFLDEFTLLNSDITYKNSIEVVKENARKRKMVECFTDGIKRLQEPGAYSIDTIVDISHTFNDLQRGKTNTHKTFGDEGLGLDRFNLEGKYMPIGIGSIDKKILGMFNGQMIVVAARPSLGKTSFIIQIIRYNHTRNILLFSLESTKFEIEQRLISLETGIPVESFHKLSKMDEVKMLHAQTVLNEEMKNLKIYDNIFEMDEIELEIKRQYNMNGVDAVFFDYLQLGEIKSMKGKRYEAVTEMSRRLKKIAMELNIPTVVISQFSRETMKDGWPQLHHLRESGAIEQDANVVIFLHKEKSEVDSNRFKYYLIVAKNKLGRIGTIDIKFDGSMFKFSEA